MAIPILDFWRRYFDNPDEGLGSTYERFIINAELFKAVRHYRIKTVLESPSFGFTGLSGINSLGLALAGAQVTINDNELERINLIKNIWQQFPLAMKIDYLKSFKVLPYPDLSFDLAWNFSALWFVDDLSLFLYELMRVTKKIIIIMVPNRRGWGYLFQKYQGRNDLLNQLQEDYIKPENFIPILTNNGWKLMHDSLIDCPLWPDIGKMKEEIFPFSLFPDSSKKKNMLTILDYYLNKSPELKEKMLKLGILEKHAPAIFKKIWAHHHYYLFKKEKKS
jgi:hypothetical protein